MACINICSPVKYPKHWQPYHTLGQPLEMECRCPSYRGLKTITNAVCFIYKNAEEELRVSKPPVFQPLDIIYCNNVDSNAQSRCQYSESVN